MIEPTESPSVSSTDFRRQLSPEQQRREANRLRRCLRKYLTLLKNVITTVVFPTKNSHSLRKHLRLNPRSRAHNLTISASHASLCLIFGIVRLVHLGRTFHNFLWVHLQLNIFHCDSPNPLSDLSIAHHSPGDQELQLQGWCLYNDLAQIFALSLESEAGTVVVRGPYEPLI